MPHRMPLQTLGQVLREARQTQGLSLRQTAVQVHHRAGQSLSPQYLSNLEQDRRSPSLPLLSALADVLEIPSSLLFAHARKAEAIVRRYLQRRPDCEAAIIELFLLAEQYQFAAWERLIRQIHRPET
jgi:transcriptional regulator with XRE-family HTH domain